MGPELGSRIDHIYHFKCDWIMRNTFNTRLNILCQPIQSHFFSILHLTVEATESPNTTVKTTDVANDEIESNGNDNSYTSLIFWLLLGVLFVLFIGIGNHIILLFCAWHKIVVALIQRCVRSYLIN